MKRMESQAFVKFNMGLCRGLREFRRVRVERKYFEGFKTCGSVCFLVGLHWLLAEIRRPIWYKILLLVFRCFRPIAPHHRTDILTLRSPSRFLQSAGYGLLSVPRTRTSSCDRPVRYIRSSAVERFTPIQYNTIQYNTIQYNTIQYNTILKTSIAPVSSA